MSFNQRLSPQFYARLHGALRKEMARENIDLLILDSNDDVIYASGFSHYASERPVAFVLDHASAWLLVPKLEESHAGAQDAQAELVCYFEFPGKVAPFDLLADATGAAPGVIGCSPGISVGRLEQIRSAFPGAAVRTTPLVSRLRYIKYPEEIVLHREAARLSDLMVRSGVEKLVRAYQDGEPLPTEIEIEAHVIRSALDTMANEHENVMLVQGIAGGLVYGGPNSAFPHAMPSSRQFVEGECFMLSLGCRVGGRAAESERTFFLGEPDAQSTRYYEAAYQAQRQAQAQMRAGNSCAKPDEAATQYLHDEGLEQYHLHRVGHGMGVMFHEPPWIEAGDSTLLQPDMVFSNEPAVYVPGVGGFRLSDTVHITAGEPVSLTKYPRTLEDIVLTRFTDPGAL